MQIIAAFQNQLVPKPELLILNSFPRFQLSNYPIPFPVFQLSYAVKVFDGFAVAWAAAELEMWAARCSSTARGKIRERFWCLQFSLDMGFAVPEKVLLKEIVGTPGSVDWALAEAAGAGAEAALGG